MEVQYPDAEKFPKQLWHAAMHPFAKGPAMFEQHTESVTKHKAIASTDNGLLDVIEQLTREHQKNIRPTLRHIERAIVRLVYEYGLGHCQLATLARCYVELAARLGEHLREEETELFPALLGCEESLEFAPAEKHVSEQLRVMQNDHQAIAAVLDRMRAATDDYQLPLSACQKYAGLLSALSSLDATLRRHGDVEEQVLHGLIDSRSYFQWPLGTKEN